MESNPDLGWRMDSSVSMNHGFASTTALACIRTRMCRLHRRLGRDQVREIACNSWPGTDHSKSEAAGPGPGARLPSPSLRFGLRLGPAYSSCMRLYYRRRGGRRREPFPPAAADVGGELAGRHVRGGEDRRHHHLARAAAAQGAGRSGGRGGRRAALNGHDPRRRVDAVFHHVPRPTAASRLEHQRDAVLRRVCICCCR
jgi:hypothetical protein